MNMMTTIGRPVPPIAILRALPPGPLARQWAHLERMRRLAPLFAAFDRDDMEAGVELLLAELDAGEAILVEDEPDFRRLVDGLPGALEDAEPDGADHGDPAWIEWQTRGRRKLERSGAERLARSASGSAIPEDDEDDDPDDVDPDVDTGNAEDEHLTSAGLRYVGGTGCAVSDPVEASLSVAEQHGGAWPFNCGDMCDLEPWVVPATLNPDRGLAVAND